LALRWFAPSLTIRPAKNWLPGKPTLLVANHPDSFLDAVIIAMACKGPIHFLARGDVFTKPWHRKLLRLLNMYPVYRIREGRAQVHLNRNTFRFSHEVLANNGTLLIFIEGICLNTHQLQLFKKGAARIALEAKDLPGCCYLPVGVAYSSFSRIGKAATVIFGETIFPEQIFEGDQEQANLTRFNRLLFPKLEACINVPSASIQSPPSPMLQLVYWISKVLHFPIYVPLRRKIAALTSGTVFYDSVLFAALLFLYPIYLLLIWVILSSAGIGAVLSTGITAFLPASSYFVLTNRLVVKSNQQAVTS
jgi:1-acyl-sn-glycerol-3-phosphate acyltransferase